jgi:uncharacterized protein YqgC (DUF456 family)
MMLLLARLGRLLGAGGRVAPFVGAALLLVVAIALLATLRSCYDSRVIAVHEAMVGAATARADRVADQKAAEQRRRDDRRLGSEAAALEGARNAPTDLERRRARHSCLRLQQAARAAGREPPACR